MDGAQKPAQDTSAEPFELVNAADDLEAKVTKLGEDLASVKNDIGVIKTLLEEDSKQKTLERALQLVTVGAFTYYKRESGGVPCSTQHLAKDAIGHFLLDSGFQLPYGQLETPELSSSSPLNFLAFRLKFTEQVKLLIRREPRVVETGGRFTMYYE